MQGILQPRPLRDQRLVRDLDRLFTGKKQASTVLRCELGGEDLTRVVEICKLSRSPGCSARLAESHQSDEYRRKQGPFDDIQAFGSDVLRFLRQSTRNATDLGIGDKEI